MKLHRKLISLLLAAVLLLGTLTLPASAAGLPFTDVPENIWYQDAVTYVYEHGLFNGTGDGSTFSPNAPMTRGMFVQVLSNKTSNFDKSTWTGKSSFSDVNKDKWYAPAVEWAYRAELISGVGDGKFAPEKNVTREQMAVIMYNYAKKTGNDASFDSDILSQFPDGGSVSSWAKEAMQWAVTHKVVNGSNGKLNPQNNAQRCEVAQVAVNADPVLENTTVEADPNFDPTFVDPTPDDLPEGACTYREFREIFSGKVEIKGVITKIHAIGNIDYDPVYVRAVDLIPFDVLDEYMLAMMKELGLIGDTDKTLSLTFYVSGLGGEEIRLIYTAPFSRPEFEIYEPARFNFFKSRLDMYY
ncbi:S-layer homology domain-containing protein [uncultured Neglectibacter sp.]|uniref:S-layer homology domain-containing protein n=1 Tax=uncultured Neglectibacter sp. TaxID=1924108 RepID=UPI0034DE16C5